MSYSPTQVIELPIEVYERFREIQHKILTRDIDPEVARYEMLEVLAPYWDHQPEPWEATEVVIKKTISNLVKLHGN